MKLKSRIIAAISPVIALVVLIVCLSWLFNSISSLRGQPEYQVELTEVQPKLEQKEEAKPELENKPTALKPRAVSAPISPIRKTEPKPPVISKPIKGHSVDGNKMPAITIYYKPIDFSNYLAALVNRGSMILVRSPLGKLVAGYDPLSGQIKPPPDDLVGYSPRSRLLAVFGENPVADRIIERAVGKTPEIMFPDGCKLIAILSLDWEQKLMEAVASAATSKGIQFEKIESAEADFADGHFRIRQISIENGGIISVNIEVPS